MRTILRMMVLLLFCSALTAQVSASITTVSSPGDSVKHKQLKGIVSAGTGIQYITIPTGFFVRDQNNPLPIYSGSGIYLNGFLTTNRWIPVAEVTYTDKKFNSHSLAYGLNIKSEKDFTPDCPYSATKLSNTGFVIFYTYSRPFIRKWDHTGMFSPFYSVKEKFQYSLNNAKSYTWGLPNGASAIKDESYILISAISPGIRFKISHILFSFSYDFAIAGYVSTHHVLSGTWAQSRYSKTETVNHFISPAEFWKTRLCYQNLQITISYIISH